MGRCRPPATRPQLGNRGPGDVAPAPDAAYKATNQKISWVRGLERDPRRTHFSSNHRTTGFMTSGPTQPQPLLHPQNNPLLPASQAIRQKVSSDFFATRKPSPPPACLATRRSGVYPINKSIARGNFPRVHYYLMSVQESAEVPTTRRVDPWHCGV